MTRIVFAFALFCLSVFPAAAQSGSFEDWREGFRERLAASGAAPETVSAMLDDLEPNPVIIERDRSQPEFVRPIWDYLAVAVSEARINNGRDALAPRADTVAAISERYGPPPEVLTAIWGLESAYGAVTGGHDIVQGLATLAWEGRRRSWAEGELISVARMIDRGYAAREDLRGSWAGAMGQTQFIPSTYLRAAVDWDGDGRRDIWQVEADALASAANLLAVEGWVEGAPIAVEVGLPEAFDLDAWDPRQRRRGHEWAAMGVSPLSGEWATDDLMRSARLILPAGASGPGFLAFENFESVRRYNNSTAYVLAVAHLSERIAGRPAWIGEWPQSARPLTRAQTRELQAGLNALGFDSGTPDGIAGPNTRRALRDFQRANGLPADGFVSMGMYEAVRAARD